MMTTHISCVTMRCRGKRCDYASHPPSPVDLPATAWVRASDKARENFPKIKQTLQVFLHLNWGLCLFKGMGVYIPHGESVKNRKLLIFDEGGGWAVNVAALFWPGRGPPAHVLLRLRAKYVLFCFFE